MFLSWYKIQTWNFENENKNNEYLELARKQIAAIERRTVGLSKIRNYIFVECCYKKVLNNSFSYIGFIGKKSDMMSCLY